jgi:ribosomal subunit interface protein
MLQVSITGLNLEVDENMHKYLMRRFGHLDRMLPRTERDQAHVEISLKDTTGEGKNDAICQVVMHLSNATFTAKETTLNLYAAVDIVYSQLQAQITKQCGPSHFWKRPTA